MSSRIFTTEALVIGSMRFKEADRIVTLYTKERGRLSAIARGVRKTKSKVGGRLEPFTLAQATLHSGRSLYTVLGVDTIRTFQGVREELFRMEEGARLLTAVRRLFPAEERNVPAFNLLVRTLARLQAAADAAAACRIVLAARLKLLSVLGYEPDLTVCAGCGEPKEIYGFSPALGGLVCIDCASGAVGCFALSDSALVALRALLSNPLTDIRAEDVDDCAAAEVEQVVVQTLAYHGH